MIDAAAKLDRATASGAQGSVAKALQVFDGWRAFLEARFDGGYRLHAPTEPVPAV
ncbi:MAG: hypothetical protein J2P47_01445 [Acetobacteraceae bacterium]|nr:hypothetical protein [Acetobacteraceae bacterium]